MLTNTHSAGLAESSGFETIGVECQLAQGMTIQWLKHPSSALIICTFCIFSKEMAELCDFPNDQVLFGKQAVNNISALLAYFCDSILKNLTFFTLGGMMMMILRIAISKELNSPPPQDYNTFTVVVKQSVFHSYTFLYCKNVSIKK